MDDMAVEGGLFSVDHRIADINTEVVFRCSAPPPFSHDFTVGARFGIARIGLIPETVNAGFKGSGFRGSGFRVQGSNSSSLSKWRRIANAVCPNQGLKIRSKANAEGITLGRGEKGTPPRHGPFSEMKSRSSPPLSVLGENTKPNS